MIKRTRFLGDFSTGYAGRNHQVRGFLYPDSDELISDMNRDRDMLVVLITKATAFRCVFFLIDGIDSTLNYLTVMPKGSVSKLAYRQTFGSA